MKLHATLAFLSAFHCTKASRCYLQDSTHNSCYNGDAQELGKVLQNQGQLASAKVCSPPPPMVSATNHHPYPTTVPIHPPETNHAPHALGHSQREKALGTVGTKGLQPPAALGERASSPGARGGWRAGLGAHATVAPPTEHAPQGRRLEAPCPLRAPSLAQPLVGHYSLLRPLIHCPPHGCGPKPQVPAALGGSAPPPRLAKKWRAELGAKAGVAPPTEHPPRSPSPTPGHPPFAGSSWKG